MTRRDDAYHMSAEDFREHGKRVIDWIADYMASVEQRDVLPSVTPGEIRAALPPSPPEHGEPFEALLKDVDRIVMPGITHWQHPGFYAYFNANASGPSILGDLLSSGLGVQGMLWSTSPAATELETHVLDWLIELLDLPATFLSSGDGGGVIQDSASSASLCALLAARERATDGRSNREGVTAGLVVYASRDAHSSIDKAVRIAGLGQHALTKINTTDTGALCVDDLRRHIAADLAAGRQPCCIMATLGTASSHGFDPLPELAELAAEHGIWLHADAAHAGTAAICPEYRWVHAGLDGADSYCFNPHKWLFTNFDCTAFWVRDRAALIRALGILPEYLKNAATASGAVIDYRDWQVPLGRRFRALKLWFVLRHYGAHGLRHHIREHIRLTQELAERIASEPQLQLDAPVPLNLICFSDRRGDAATQALLDALNASGHAFLTHTRIAGRLVARICIGGTWTREEHIDALWQRIRQILMANRA